MDPLLQSLVDLQKSLNEQMRLKRRIKAIPTEIEAIKQNRALLEQRREEHREAFKDMEKRERHCEAELADTEQAIRHEAISGIRSTSRQRRQRTSWPSEIDSRGGGVA